MERLATRKIVEPNPEGYELPVTMGKVKHTITDLNPQFAAELPFKKGSNDTPFGYFACVKFDADVVERPYYTLGVLPGHNRSVIWGSFNFRAFDGTLYRDIDIKGGGHTSYQEALRAVEDKGDIHHPEMLEPARIQRNDEHATPNDYWGLMSMKEATHDMRMAEELAKIGIKAVRGMTILRLKELFVPKEGLVPVSTLREEIFTKKNPTDIHLERDFDPVLYVRAYGVRSRLNEYPSQLEKMIPKETLATRRAELVRDAMHFVAGEEGIPVEAFTLDRYLSWYATSLGKLLGRLHANGLSGHGNICNSKSKERRADDPANLTLDCRLVDLQTVAKLKGDKDKKYMHIRDDQEDGLWALNNLLDMAKGLDPSSSEEGWHKKRMETLGRMLIESAYQEYAAVRRLSKQKNGGELGYEDMRMDGFGSWQTGLKKSLAES